MHRKGRGDAAGRWECVVRTEAMLLLALTVLTGAAGAAVRLPGGAKPLSDLAQVQQEAKEKTRGVAFLFVDATGTNAAQASAIGRVASELGSQCLPVGVDPSRDRNSLPGPVKSALRAGEVIAVVTDPECAKLWATVRMSGPADLGRQIEDARTEIKKAITSIRDAGKPKAPAKKNKDDGNFRRKTHRIIRQIQKAQGGT